MPCYLSVRNGRKRAILFLLQKCSMFHKQDKAGLSHTYLLPDDCCLNETLSCNNGFELTHFYVGFRPALSYLWNIELFCGKKKKLTVCVNLEQKGSTAAAILECTCQRNRELFHSSVDARQNNAHVFILFTRTCVNLGGNVSR